MTYTEKMGRESGDRYKHSPAELLYCSYQQENNNIRALPAYVDASPVLGSGVKDVFLQQRCIKANFISTDILNVG